MRTQLACRSGLKDLNVIDSSPTTSLRLYVILDKHFNLTLVWKIETKLGSESHFQVGSIITANRSIEDKKDGARKDDNEPKENKVCCRAGRD